MLPVACDTIPVACDAIPVTHNAISVSREGGNLHLGGLYQDLDKSVKPSLLPNGAGLLMQVLRQRGDDANLRITVESLRFSLIEWQLYEMTMNRK